jgi:hypothetical protein
MTAMLMVSLALLTACTSTRRTQEQEKEALQLLGALVTGRISVGPCSPDATPLMMANSTIEQWLSRDGKAGNLHVLASEVAGFAKSCNQLETTHFIEKHPEIEKVRKILGNEDTTMADKGEINGRDTPFTWYKFGWLHFGVVDGKVEILRADHKRSGV